MLKQSEFRAGAWNNSKYLQSGGGYGFTISAADRDAHLRREWGTVDLHLPGRAEPAKVNVDKASLWKGNCLHLISREIGTWLIDNDMASWPRRRPPKFRLVPRGARAFDVLLA
jgi:hypothetical protein